MPKVFLTFWLVLCGTTQLMAQIKKDTIRIELNYRLPQSLRSSGQSSYNIRSSIASSNDKALSDSRSFKATRRVDTLREEIDYRQPKSIRKPSLGGNNLFTHYIGLQLNHVIELSGLKASSENRNPYTLVYGFNHTRTGLGLGVALGLQTSLNEKKLQPDAFEETANDKTSFRLGVDIKRSIHKRWRLGMGIDLLLSRQTYLKKVYSNGFVTENRDDTKGFGLGPRISLQYLVNSRFRIGTEVCMYFESFKTRSQKKFTGLPAEHANSSASDNSFLYPISVFVIARIW